MKINKNTSIICIIFSIIFGVLTVVLQPFHELSSSIVASIFTGFIVSAVVALIGYFHEKEKILNNISNNIRNLYINLLAIKNITGKIIPKVATANDLTKLEYSTIEALTALNIEFAKKMELELYEGFFGNSKLSKIINEFISLKNEQYNLKNLAFKLYRETLEYQLSESEVKKIRLQGKEVPANYIKDQAEYKNLINIQTAKFHEYEAGLILKLDKLAEEFDKCYKSKLGWSEFKESCNNK